MQKEKVPPVSNRGAQNTHEQGLKVLVDWVSVTLKNLQPDELIGVIGLDPDDFVELEYGYSGYRRQVRCGNIAVYFDGREDMGIHLQMSGQGCREYEGKPGFRGWQVFFLRLLDLGGKLTRLDLAVDDFTGYFTLDTIYRKIRAGEVSSRFKDAVAYEKVSLGDGSRKGSTVYFGSASSRIQIRFYDKLAERLAKGEIIEGLDFWNRTELELRKERAQKAGEMIAFTEDAGRVTMGILKEYVRFLVKGKDKNKSRWKTARFWEKFLGDVKNVKLTDEPVERTLEKTVSWLERQVTPSLKAVVEAESIDFLVEMIERAFERLRPEHIHMIERHKERKERQEFWEAKLYDNEERKREMWKRRRAIVWRLQGIEKDPISGQIRSKYKQVYS